jgi:hypothetical protein
MTNSVLENGELALQLNLADDQPLVLTSGVVTSLPPHGTLYDGNTAVLATNLPYTIGGAPGHFNLTYRPDRDYAGPDQFSYRGWDGQAWGDAGTVRHHGHPSQPAAELRGQ